jgi:arsenite oxidase large subunit
MKALNVAAGDIVEIFNDSGSTQAKAQPTPSAKRNQTFMLFAFPTGVQGNVVNAGVNELIIPNYKQTWADIRKIASASETTKRVSFKSPEYKT